MNARKQDESPGTRPEAGENGLPVELRILELFTSSTLAVIGPSDVERMTGSSKGTASRALKLLEVAGYLAAVGTGRYSLGPKMFVQTTRYMGCVLAQIDATQKMFNSTVELMRSSFSQLQSAMPLAPAVAGGEA